MAAESEVEQKQRRRRKEKGNGREPSSVPDTGRPSMGSDCDRRLRALCREHNHRAVTVMVASNVDVITDACD
jgi:hypothetical protein